MILVLCLLSCFAPAAAFAEAGSADETGFACGGCFKGDPCPPCSRFVVLEAARGWRITNPGGNSYAGKSGDPWFNLDAGYLWNLSSGGAALGGVASLGVPYGGQNAHLGVHLRYRRWLGRSLSLDLSPGILLSGEPGFRFPGAVVHLGFMVEDLIGVNGALEVGRRDGEKTDYGLYGGIQIGSYVTYALGMVVGWIGHIFEDWD